MNKQAAVIIPFYKTELSPTESVALEQCFRILSGHAIIAVKPQSLVLPDAVTAYPFSGVESFDNNFFRSVDGYNELMMSEKFYGRFLAYEYMLIYQLDAFVFKDELAYWCSQDIDYVGAPWIRRKKYSTVVKGIVLKGLQYLHKRYNVKKHGLPSKRQFDDNVGNGGFSLRRVKVFYDICIKYHEKIAEYNMQTTHHYNEDVFWGIELNRKRKVLKIPNYKKALHFSVEFHPQRAFMLNHDQLPFGCHGWDMKVNIDYWRPIINKYGYEV